MYLPALLVRDYGIAGFLIFAVPNVIGAAAMGWVLSRKEAARRLVEKHRLACLAFSIVTVAFHAYFITWLARSMGPHFGFEATGAHRAGPWVIAGIVGVVVALMIRRGLDVWAAALVYIVSLCAIIAFYQPMVSVYDDYRSPAFGWGVAGGPAFPGALFLAPVCIFGFLLCPYLDLTFHRANLATTPRGGRVAFSLGFGVFFLLMILFTLAYAGLFAFPTEYQVVCWAAIIVSTHVLCQAAFTVIVHLREVVIRRQIASWLLPAATVLFVLAIIAALGLARDIDDSRLSWIRDELNAQMPMRPGEIGYRVFMSFYGLLFPAYVWLCMIPTRAPRFGPAATTEPGKPHSGLDGPIGRRKLLVLLIAVAIAAPMYWLGFIERQEIWLLPGLIVVLLSRALLPGGLWLPFRTKAAA